MQKRTRTFWLVVGLIISVATPLHAGETKRVRVGAAFNVEAAGCEHKAQEFTVTAPAPCAHGSTLTNPIDNQKVCRNPTGAKSAANVFAWVFEAKK